MRQPWTRARNLLHAVRARQSAQLLSLACALRMAQADSKEFGRWAASLEAGQG